MKYDEKTIRKVVENVLSRLNVSDSGPTQARNGRASIGCGELSSSQSDTASKGVGRIDSIWRVMT